MAPEVQLDDDFRALGLAPGAKPSEVKRAYRTLAKKWHPDRHHTAPYEARALAEEKFREIDQAYRRISKTWQKTSASPLSAEKDFSAPKPEAAKPRSGFRFMRRRLSPAPFFSRAWPLSPTARYVAAGAFVLILLIPLLSDIGPDRPTRVREKGQQVPTTVTTHGAALPKPPSPSSGPPPSPPGAGASAHFFTLGSSESEVLGIQGRPTRIQGNTWIYGISEINFRNGRVCGYNNFDKSLRVKMVPEGQPPRSTDHITIGSTERQVLQVQGTPSRIEGNRWYYGFSEITFEDGLVTGYDNYFGTLKIRLLPSAPAGPEKKAYFFTRGSTPDQVLAVQGTPTAVHGNRWSYNFDYVIFRDGKVSTVIDTDGALRFVNPERPGVAEGP
jgi:outer membrane protein assembly factor BamE (lipoprotein component of BamABCDE complex)